MFFSFDWYIFSEVCSMKIIFYVSELLTPSFLYFMLHNRCLCWTNLRNLPSWQSFFTPLTQNRISGYFESYSSAHFLSPRTVPPPSSSLAVRCLEKNNLKVTTHGVLANPAKNNHNHGSIIPEATERNDSRIKRKRTFPRVHAIFLMVQIKWVQCKHCTLLSGQFSPLTTSKCHATKPVQS